MTVESKENMEISKGVKQKILKTMELFSVPENIKNLCLQLLDIEYAMSSDILRLKEKFRDDFEINQSNPTKAIPFIQSCIQESLKNFKLWHDSLEEHHITSMNAAPLKAPSHLDQLNTPCLLRSKQLEIQEGESVKVIDNSQDGSIKVRSKSGVEGHISLMSLILPNSDKSLHGFIERLKVQLLCWWFECFRLLFANTYNLIYALLIQLKYRCPSLPSHSNGPRSSRDLKLLKKLVKRLELDYLDNDKLKELGVVVDEKNQQSVQKVCALFHDYQAFEKLFKSLKSKVGGKSRSICIFDKLSEFKAQQLTSNPIKFYKTKVVVQSVETLEEILHYPNDDAVSTTSSTMSSHERTRVESERMTSSSQEVKQRFVIKSIKDPRDGSEVSLDQAIAKGILDMSKGLYINPNTGESKPIVSAMNQGQIQVQMVTEVASKAKVEQYGMMTVKSLAEDEDANDEREFEVLSVVDPLTAEKINEQEAVRRGWLCGGWEGGEWVEGKRLGATWVGGGAFKITGGTTLTIHEAVDEGWIKAEVTNKERIEALEKERHYEAKTYMIKKVLNSRSNRMVTFNEAMRFGLLDVDSGCWVDKQTEERVMLDDALKRGFIKGRLMKEGEGTAIDPVNKVVAKNVEEVKNDAGVLNKKQAPENGGGDGHLNNGREKKDAARNGDSDIQSKQASESFTEPLHVKPACNFSKASDENSEDQNGESKNHINIGSEHDKQELNGKKNNFNNAQKVDSSVKVDDEKNSAISSANELKSNSKDTNGDASANGNGDEEKEEQGTVQPNEDEAKTEEASEKGDSSMNEDASKNKKKKKKNKKKK